VSNAQGIDVSRYQGQVDWAAAAAGLDFVFIKATEGVGYVDAQFANNWAGARRAGLARGAYHFCRPGNGHPVDQAQWFAHIVGPLQPGDLPPVADFEVTDHRSPQDCHDWLVQFLAECERQFGRRPILYASPGFFAGAVGDTAAFTGYPLWVAHYTTAAEPHLPRGFTDWLFWQYADNGQVPGCRGYVDRNVFHGDHNAFAAFMARTPMTTPVSSSTKPAPKGVVVADHVTSLASPNGGVWHLQADGGIVTDHLYDGGQDAPFYGSVPGVGGLAAGMTVVDLVADRGGYAVVATHSDGTVSYYNFPAA
jgi:GH25 family lysozyme M1 (1,4-beta-N-acetylmuramidase)